MLRSFLFAVMASVALASNSSNATVAPTTGSKDPNATVAPTTTVAKENATVAPTTGGKTTTGNDTTAPPATTGGSKITTKGNDTTAPPATTGGSKITTKGNDTTAPGKGKDTVSPTKAPGSTPGKTGSPPDEQKVEDAKPKATNFTAASKSVAVAVPMELKSSVADAVLNDCEATTSYTNTLAIASDLTFADALKGTFRDTSKAITRCGDDGKPAEGYEQCIGQAGGDPELDGTTKLASCATYVRGAGIFMLKTRRVLEAQRLRELSANGTEVVFKTSPKYVQYVTEKQITVDGGGSLDSLITQATARIKKETEKPSFTAAVVSNVKKVKDAIVSGNMGTLDIPMIPAAKGTSGAATKLPLEKAIGKTGASTMPPAAKAAADKADSIVVAAKEPEKAKEKPTTPAASTSGAVETVLSAAALVASVLMM